MVRLSFVSPRFLAGISSMSVRSMTTSSTSKNAVDVPEPPKRPLSSFIAFSVKTRSEIAEHGPDMKNDQVLNHIKSAWRGLTPDNKKILGEQWAKRYLDFKTQRAKWWANLSVEQQEAFDRAQKDTKKKKRDRKLKKHLRLLGKPRKPLSAYNFYVSRNMNQFKEKDPALVRDNFGKLGLLWKGMSDEDKKPYVDMEVKDLENYGKELKAWEAKMHLEGHDEFIPKKRAAKLDKMSVKSEVANHSTPSKKKTSTKKSV